MKKYLMTGIAALALCVGFTSCSHDLESLSQEEIDQLEAQKITEKYNKAFIATFGQPAADQDWGFGPTSAGRTRTENANANEWADPTKAYGGLKVPPPLTTDQIAVVKKYFQTVPNIDYEDPHWTNYFIQQVYKGNPQTAGAYSPEQYLSAAGGNNYILASDHMDHLIAIDEEEGIVDHINNFNHGDCSSNDHVLTWSPDFVSSANTGPWHTDKIMYMKNSTTKHFAYHNSDGSLYHTEYTGLVNFQTIIDALGAEANCLNDGWNRSFMGFDFEQIVGDDVYSKNYDLDYAGGYKQPYEYEEGVEYYNGFRVKSVTYNTFEFEGKTYNYLVNNTNMFAADRTENSYVQKNGSYSQDPGKANFNDKPNDDIIRDLLSKGYLPYTDTQKDWVKVGGTADGYFSDWIVTLTEAKGPKPTPDPFEAQLRIMAEDLSASEKSDFDFNDIVFDVQYTSDTHPARILVRAAGGTLPLRIRIGGTSTDGSDWEWQEIHALWGKSTGIMINTNATTIVGGGKGYEADYDLDPIDLKYVVAGKADAKNIIIEVNKGGAWRPMDAEKGMPAAKFACSPDHDWADELQSLSGNTNFEDWVQGRASDWEWTNF